MEHSSNIEKIIEIDLKNNNLEGKDTKLNSQYFVYKPDKKESKDDFQNNNHYKKIHDSMVLNEYLSKSVKNQEPYMGLKEKFENNEVSTNSSIFSVDIKNNTNLEQQCDSFYTPILSQSQITKRNSNAEAKMFLKKQKDRWLHPVNDMTLEEKSKIRISFCRRRRIFLKEVFDIVDYPNKDVYMILRTMMNEPVKGIKIWFRNARAAKKRNEITQNISIKNRQDNN